VASGPEAALDALEKWLWKGPPAARVDGVVREAIADCGMEGFRVG
jgi:acylphosphatase